MNQADYWNGEAVAVWASQAERLDAMLEPLGRVAMDALSPRTGERVLDVGCGAGATSRALAERVGASGHVLGVDVSRSLVNLARGHAGGPEYLLADAASASFAGAPFDAVFSRFGVMFFEDPTAAFAHVRGALRQGGRLAFVCWRGMAENPWARDVMTAALPFVKQPPPAPPSGAPGPFAFADGTRLRGILEAAGWEAVKTTPFETHYVLGTSPEDATERSLLMGPLGKLIREQGLDPQPIRVALRSLMLRHTVDGGVAMPAACWIVTARA